jgi:hypothetical protein
LRRALPSAPWLSPLPLPLPQRITVRLPPGFGVPWYPSASLSLPPPLPQEFLRFVGVVSQEAVLIPESRRSRRTGLGRDLPDTDVCRKSDRQLVLSAAPAIDTQAIVSMMLPSALVELLEELEFAPPRSAIELSMNDEIID